MKEVLLIFAGGGLGSVVRFGLGKWVTTFHGQNFPWGTLAVNVTACLVLGCVVGLADHKHLIGPSSRVFWAIGFCGGFSTFSTFSAETLALVQGGFTLSAAGYVISSVVLCVGSVALGIYAGEHL